jgi:hypothetical protein
MTPAVARLKRGVIAAVALNGGGDGAAATAGRQRSVAYDWGNINHRALPPVDCAFALDEVAMAQDRTPPIIAAYARELGGVFVPLPDAGADPDTLAGMVMELMQRLGELSREMAAAIANDGVVDAREAAAMLDIKQEHDAVSARLTLALERIAALDQAGGGA